jgi:hypothetical protein
LKKNTEVQEFRSSEVQDSPEAWTTGELIKFQKEINLIKIDTLFYMKTSQKII